MHLYVPEYVEPPSGHGLATFPLFTVPPAPVLLYGEVVLVLYLKVEPATVSPALKIPEVFAGIVIAYQLSVVLPIESTFVVTTAPVCPLTEDTAPG
jgi:hypothetical protein